MKKFQRVGILGIALFFGLMTLLLCTALFISLVIGARPIQTDIIVRDGTSVWLVDGADAFGLSWRSADQTTDLQVPSPDLHAAKGQWTDVDSDGWCELLPWPTRTGALAVGWPSPWMVWRFSSGNERDWFPRPNINADQIEEMSTAVSRIYVGGHLTMSLESFGVAAAVILTSSAAWWILIRASIRFVTLRKK